MSKYYVDISDTAKDNIKMFEKAGKKLILKKINNLIEELYDHPRIGTGHPEPLIGFEGKRWSRRINKEHRLCYEIQDDIVVVLVLSAYGHYKDE